MGGKKEIYRDVRFFHGAIHLSKTRHIQTNPIRHVYDKSKTNPQNGV